MPRQLRIQYPGAMYHVMSRGNRRAEIFLDDVDRHDFLKTLAEACQKTGWQVHAYCLMANHYHLVLETPNANLVAGMAWLQSIRSSLRLRCGCGARPPFRSRRLSSACTWAPPKAPTFACMRRWPTPLLPPPPNPPSGYE